jgi:hypothetical protein
MRKFLLIAAAAMIALIGLSANQCSGSNEQKATPTTTEAPAAKPDESGNMGSEAPAAKPDESGNMGSDTGNAGSDSSNNMQGETPSQ